MSALTARFPSARRLQRSLSRGAMPGSPPADDLIRLVEPYLGWALLEMDSESTDILIGEPEAGPEAGQPRELLVLGGEIAQIWLRHAHKRAP